MSAFQKVSGAEMVPVAAANLELLKQDPQFFFSSNELQVFPPVEAQLGCSSQKLHHGQEEGIQHVSRVQENCLIVVVCFRKRKEVKKERNVDLSRGQV